MSNVRSAFLKVVRCDAMRLQKKEAAINDLGTKSTRGSSCGQQEAVLCFKKGSTRIRCAARCIIYGECLLPVVILKFWYLRKSVTFCAVGAFPIVMGKRNIGKAEFKFGTGSLFSNWQVGNSALRGTLCKPPSRYMTSIPSTFQQDGTPYFLTLNLCPMHF